MKIRSTILPALAMLVIAFASCRFIGHRGKPEASYALAPDGKRIAFSSNDGDLYLLDLETNEVKQLTSTPAYEKRLVLARRQVHSLRIRTFRRPVQQPRLSHADR